MKIAVYPGTFDPLTNGHVDVALRARKIFDKVIILVADNSSKKGHTFFTPQERVAIAKEVFAQYDGFEVTWTDKIVVKEAKRLGAQALIRGLRAVTDYEAEYQLHEANEYIEPSIDMVYLMSHREQAFISSTNIKELFAYDEDISDLVPPAVLKAMKKKAGKE